MIFRNDHAKWKLLILCCDDFISYDHDFT